jgi:hypothetical protein
MPGAAAAIATSTALGSAFVAAAAAASYGFAATVAFGIIGTIIQTLVVSLVLGAISSALSSKPSINRPTSPNGSALADIARDRTVTFRQPIVAHRLIYGECRVAGPLTFVESTDDNEQLHQLITIAGHAVQEIGEFWVNDGKVTDSSGAINSGDFSGKITVLKGLGTTAGDSALNTALISATSGWTANHKQSSRAKLYIKLVFDSDIFIGSLPSVSALVKGKKIYDTRDAGTRYSNNPALVIYDYLTDTDVGVGELAARIDTASFTTAANVCDEDVTAVLSRTFLTTHATELVTLSSAANGFRTGDKCRVSSAGTLPSGFSAGTDYFWISISTTTGNLASSKANAIAGTKVAISSDGSGTHTIKRRKITTFTAATTDIITIASAFKDLLTGDGMQFSTTGTLPAGLSAATTYYWIRLTDTTGKVGTTLLNALAGTVVDITNTGSGTHSAEKTSEPRYTCNGTVDTASTPKEILTQLLTSMNGSLVYQNGKWTIYAGEYRTPTITIAEDDMAGPIKIQVKISRRELFNGVKGVFASPVDNYQPTDFPAVTNATYFAEDQDERLWKDIDLQYTVSPSMAQRIGKIDLERARQQITVNITTNLTGLRLQAGDTVSLTNSRMGWSAKAFDLIDWGLTTQADATGALSLVCAMKLRETASGVYDWNGGEETITDLAPNTTLPDPFTVAVPTNLAMTEALYVTTNGSGVKVRGVLSWTASADSFVNQYHTEYKLSSDDDFIQGGRVFGAVTHNVNDLATGVYDFRVKAINQLGVSSSYITITSQTIAGLVANPTDIAGLSVIALNNQAHISWDLHPDLDVRHGGKIRFRHSNVSDGTAQWESSTDIGAAVAGHNTETVLPLVAGTYMSRAVDSTGNESLGTTSFVITTIPNITPMNLVSTITAHPTFTGTLVGLDVIDGVLKFESAVNFDSRTDLMDTWVFFDSYNTGVDTAGTFEFDGVDLGGVLTSRVTHDLAFNTFLIGDYLDSRSGNVDDYDDWDNQPADLNIDLYVATTNQEVDDSPTWSEYAKFKTGDFTCRGYKFKLVASSTDADHQFNVTALSITVDMPDRVQGVRTITSGAGTKSVVYPSNFYAIPSLGITAQNMATGDFFTLANEATTGFDVTFKNSSGSAISRIFNYQSKGY